MRLYRLSFRAFIKILSTLSSLAIYVTFNLVAAESIPVAICVPCPCKSTVINYQHPAHFRSSDLVHDDHSCDNRQTCPITCELCPRFCSMGDHFHGLEPDQVHLCGYVTDSTKTEVPNICSSDFHYLVKITIVPRTVRRKESAKSIRHRVQSRLSSRVDMAPSNIQKLVNERHCTESLLTRRPKYSQVAKRLRCSVKIPSGERVHAGPHTHSNAKGDVFHYCEAVCRNCGYICHLPLSESHPSILLVQTNARSRRSSPE